MIWNDLQSGARYLSKFDTELADTTCTDFDAICSMSTFPESARPITFFPASCTITFEGPKKHQSSIDVAPFEDFWTVHSSTTFIAGNESTHRRHVVQAFALCRKCQRIMFWLNLTLSRRVNLNHRKRCAYSWRATHTCPICCSIRRFCGVISDTSAHLRMLTSLSTRGWTKRQWRRTSSGNVKQKVMSVVRCKQGWQFRRVISAFSAEARCIVKLPKFRK